MKTNKATFSLVFLASTIVSFFGIAPRNNTAEAHCTGYHPHHCSINDIREFPEQIPQELENLRNTACASLFVTTTRGILASASGNPTFLNQRVQSLLVNTGLFEDSEFNNVTMQYANLRGYAEGMVPAPNRILIDNAYRNASSTELAPLIAHEMVHIRQLRRMGNERFACTYSDEIAQLGNAAFYERNPLEREAYEMENRVANLIQGSRPQISEGAFKFSHHPAIYYSNGVGHYCWYRSWEDFVELTNGNTTWRDLSGTLKDYSMEYDGGCGSGGRNTSHPDPDNS